MKKHNYYPILLILFFLNESLGLAQNVSINDNGAAPDAKAILDIDISTNDKGILIPRLTTAQKNAIAAPPVGLTVFDTDMGDFQFYTGLAWKTVGAVGNNSIYTGSGSLSGNTTVTQGANTIAFTSSATNGFSVDGTTFSVDAANDRMGIGTTTPGTLLNIVKNQNAQTAVLLENSTAGASSSAEFQIKNDANEYNKMGIYSSVTPAYGALASNNAYLYTGSTGFTLMADDVAGVIKFATGGNSEQARFDASGNLGIGTTAPSARLSIANGATSSGTMSIFEDTDNGINKATITIPAALAADYTLILPPDDGAAGEQLRTDGTGNLSWGKRPAVYYQTSAAACNNANEASSYCTIITQNFTTSATSSTVVLDFSGAYGSGACSNINAGAAIILNGTNVISANYVSVFAGNYSSVTIPLKYVTTVAAGNHTVNIRIYKMWNSECQINNLAPAALITTVYE